MTDETVVELERLRRDIGELSGRVRDHDITLAQQELIEVRLGQVSEQVADLVIKLELDEEPAKGYKPWHNPRWWDLGPDEKEAEVGRIRGWYRDIARQYLGTAGLPQCVLDHDVSLLMLDAVSETWRSLYVPERRSVSMAASQCEFVIRIWPGIRAELVRVLSGCSHQTGLDINLQVAS